MKTAKKVLSIVLAVMMILSTMVIAVSAAADDVSYTWTLSAEVYNATGAAEAKASGYEETPNTKAPTLTEQKKDVNAYKALEEHTYADPSETIYVQAGQVVWITLHVKSTGGSYVSALENCLYYTKNLFYSCTNTLSGCMVVNPDSTWAAYDCMSWTTGNTWARMNAAGRKKYVTNLGMSTDTYHAYYLFGKPSDPAALDGVMVADIDDDFISFPIYVDPDAALGTTGQIFLGGNFKTWAEGYAELEGDVWGGDPDQWIGDAHDQSGAVLNFKVGTKPAGVDYSALNQAIADFEALTESDYTPDSWADAEAAYNDALDAKTATVQATVDAAKDALLAAIDALDEAVALDYTRINAAIDAADAADTTNATTSSAAALDNALEAAVAAVANATTQDELDTAAAALETAIAGLEDKADMTAIYDALAYADGLDKSDWSDESLDELDSLIADAQAILAQADDFSDQDAVDAAAQAIYDMQISIESADYNEVWALMDEASFLNEDDYTTASWAALETALGAVVPNLFKSQQARVDGFAADISEALDGLKEVAYTASLELYVAEANAADEDDYAAVVWAAIQDKVALANTYIGADLAREDVQDDIDALAMELIDLLNNKLDDADYTAVEAAFAKIPADIETGIYTDESKAALDSAAEAVVWGLKEDKQAQVDKMAQDLEDAIAGLEKLGADYDMVDKYLAQAAGINRDLYTAASLDVLDAAVAAVVRDLDITHQDEVTNMANDLYVALDGLEYAGADFSAIDEIAENAGDLAREFYTDDSLAAYDAAVADALAIYANKAAYTIADQAVIDAAAAKGADATSLLVAKDADFTEIDALLARADDLDPSIYTEASWNAFNAAFEGTLYVYNNKAYYDIFDQGHIDVKAEDGEAAFDLLVVADGDYTEINKYLGQIAALNGDEYTTASWEALQDFIDTIPMDLKADKQDEIDENAFNLRKAKNALVLAAAGDYSAVDAQIEAFNKLDTDLYTADSVKAVEDAIANVTTGLNENHQSEIDAMAAAIETAIKGLVEITYDAADYTAVDEAIALFNTKDQAIYTADSVNAVKAAIANVVRGLDERDQATVDGFAAAINAAIEALELLPEPEGMVVDVQYTETTDMAKTFTVKVEGRAFKIQFIDENGNTSTFSRVDVKDQIVSYNEAGEECTDIARDLAYEIWTIDRTVKDGTIIVKARNEETGWESDDLGYVVNVVSPEKDVLVKNVETYNSANLYENLPVKVTTGKDVLKVQLLVNGTAYKTFDKTSATVEDDNLVFDGHVKLNTKGTNTITIMVKTASGWTTSDTSVTVNGVKSTDLPK